MSILVALMLALAPPPTAHAPPQSYTPLGTRLPRPLRAKELESQQRAVEMLQKFSACVVKAEPVRAAAAVDMPLGASSQARSDAIHRMDSTMSYCLTRLNGGTMEGRMSAYVGAFAEQLYRRKWAALPALGNSAVPPASDPEEQSVRVTLAFADCLIDRAPAAADLLVRSDARSPQEREALSTLSPHYGNCLDAGTTLAATRLALRNALSEQLYRRALAGGTPATPLTKAPAVAR